MVDSDQRNYDLIVIGGGINGSAIARDASLRGLSVLLLEREDFGCGASSKSSKLAHGGLRYLEQFHFGLVRKSLQERGLLFRNAPGLVRPLPFIFPVYAQTGRPLWMVRIGLTLYDWLAWDSSLPGHRRRSAREITQQFPALRQEGLKGGILYYDGQLEDHRLVVENMLAAKRLGCEAHNYAPVEELLQENGHVRGVRYSLKGRFYSAYAPAVVNATGPWTNGLCAMDPVPGKTQVRPTKGVHITLPLVHADTALILQTPQDRRIFFVIPWEGVSLVGTTDTDYQGDPSRVAAEERDVEYLLNAYNHYFPSAPRSKEEVISAFAGLRPLVTDSEDRPSDVSREETLEISPSGLITLAGGKYTTFRAMAEEAVNLAASRCAYKNLSPCSTRTEPLLKPLEQLPVSSALSPSCVERLARTYGQAALEILKRAEADPALAHPLCTLHDHPVAELLHALESEEVRELEDWYFRRTSIGYHACGGRSCLEETAAHFQRVLGWSNEEKEERMREYVPFVPG